jgi:hypothetical protein
MVLIGSLVFFLLEVGYAGAAVGRLRWTLFWFVFAMVLVSRIAMEQSSGAALLYGAALAAATALMLTRYLGSVWGVWLLLGVVWWASHQIVWDCTLIDEDADASGQGLIGACRLSQWTRQRLTRVRAVPAVERASGSPAGRASTESTAPSRYSSGSHVPVPGRSPKARQHVHPQKLHAPGLWVLYFSIAAVPIFGVGELLLSPDDARSRTAGFILLLAYLGSALGLLLLTSFLGLRRYLRQRRIVMPGEMARGWVTAGVVLTAGVLLGATLLPRPATPYSLGNWVTKLSSSPQAAAKQAPSARDKRAGDEPGPSEAERPDAWEDETGSVARGERGQTDGAGETGNTAGSVPSGATPVPRLPFKLEKWVSHLVALLVAAFLLIRYWAQVWGVLSGFAGWLRGLRTRERREKTRRERLLSGWPRSPPVPANPFHTGEAARMSLEELVRYSYDALRQWGQARGIQLDESETPLELAERLSEHEPALTREIRLLGSYYSRLIYGNQPPPEDCLGALESLWDQF